MRIDSDEVGFDAPDADATRGMARRRSNATDVGRRRVVAVAAGVGLSWSLGPWAASRATAAPAGERVRWPVVGLIDGRQLPPTHWHDRLAVIVFWSTTCPYCRRHNQHIDRLDRAARALGAPLAVLGVARDRDDGAVRRHLAVQRHGFDVTTQAGALGAQLAPRALVPQTAVVGRDGRLQQVLPGEMAEADVMELLALASPGSRS